MLGRRLGRPEGERERTEKNGRKQSFRVFHVKVSGQAPSGSGATGVPRRQTSGGRAQGRAKHQSAKTIAAEIHPDRIPRRCRGRCHLSSTPLCATQDRARVAASAWPPQMRGSCHRVTSQGRNTVHYNGCADDPTAIEFDRVAYVQPSGVPVLEALTLDIRRGEVVALVGRSGAGKTTMLRLVNRLPLPQRGACWSGAGIPASGIRSRCAGRSATSFRTSGFFRT